jgi:SAM-dependent methyltransferase
LHSETNALTTEQPAASLYDSRFYESLRDGTERSAATVVPILIELFRPRSVVDVGCGAGLWLAAFRRNGIDDVLGIDGPWVGGEQRAISERHFLEHDLSRPLRLDRRFDLALCLEVAEHLPTEAAAPLVESLTALSSVVIFSAAVPFQGGDGHINERWSSYWAGFFDARGFSCLSGLRRRIWDNDAIEVWYRQNIFCYVARDRLDDFHHLDSAESSGTHEPIDIVHPHLFLRRMNEFERQSRFTARLEVEKTRLEADLATARSELASIKNSKVWRIYNTARSVLKRASRLTKQR